jgi:hypothetical protein
MAIGTAMLHTACPTRNVIVLYASTPSPRHRRHRVADVPLEVRVEQALVHQAGLDETVGEPEHKDGRPTATGAAGHLADEQRTAAVERCQHGQRGQQPRGDVAQQELAHPGREEE